MGLHPKWLLERDAGSHELSRASSSKMGQNWHGSFNLCLIFCSVHLVFLGVLEAACPWLGYKVVLGWVQPPG